MLRTRAKDKVGTVINNWKILSVCGRTRSGCALFKAQSLINGRVVTAAYGALKANKYAHIQKTSKTEKRLRSIWYNMKQRCYNINSKNYIYYGARGIRICQEWLEDFNNFKEWSEEHGYQSHLTIDRLNPYKDYNPDNCRWVPVTENAKWSTRSTVMWIDVYCDTESGWSKRVGQYTTWFSGMKYRHDYDYAYQKLLEEIKKLGGIKKVMGVEEEPDISQVLKDIESDCLEVDP